MTNLVEARPTPAATRRIAGYHFGWWDADGQHADLSFEDRTDVDLLECIEMARAKTAALLGCACTLGAAFAPASAAQVTLLRDFGERLGLAVHRDR